MPTETDAEIEARLNREAEARRLDREAMARYAVACDEARRWREKMVNRLLIIAAIACFLYVIHTAF